MYADVQRTTPLNVQYIKSFVPIFILPLVKIVQHFIIYLSVFPTFATHLLL